MLQRWLQRHHGVHPVFHTTIRLKCLRERKGYFKLILSLRKSPWRLIGVFQLWTVRVTARTVIWASLQPWIPVLTSTVLQQPRKEYNGVSLYFWNLISTYLSYFLLLCDKFYTTSFFMNCTISYRKLVKIHSVGLKNFALFVKQEISEWPYFMCCRFVCCFWLILC